MEETKYTSLSGEEIDSLRKKYELERLETFIDKACKFARKEYKAWWNDSIESKFRAYMKG